MHTVFLLSGLGSIAGIAPIESLGVGLDLEPGSPHHIPGMDPESQVDQVRRF